MMRYEPPVDPTQAPWMSWRENGKQVTVCRHCNTYYQPNNTDADNHYRWCKWWLAYVEYMSSPDE